MKKYFVAFKVYATTWIEVEAENEDEAREKAESEVNEPCLCHQCADELEVEGLGDCVAVSEK